MGEWLFFIQGVTSLITGTIFNSSVLLFLLNDIPLGVGIEPHGCTLPSGFPILFQSETELLVVSLFGEGDQHWLGKVDGFCVLWLLGGTNNNFGFIPKGILPLINVNWGFKVLSGITPLKKAALAPMLFFPSSVIFVDDDNLESWSLTLVFVFDDFLIADE